jgi:DUF971 family protein
MNAPRPTRIVLHKASRELEVGYADGTCHRLPAEYLRVHSPSAEVQGHGKPVLVGGHVLGDLRAAARGDANVARQRRG